MSEQRSRALEIAGSAVLAAAIVAVASRFSEDEPAVEQCVRAECFLPDGAIDDEGVEGQGACWRNLPPDLGLDGGPRWIGCWNRFPASLGVGPGCKPVPCADSSVGTGD